MNFAFLRFIIALAVLVPWFLTRGSDGSAAEMFIVAFVAFGAGHLGEMLYRRRHPETAGNPSLMTKVFLTGAVAIGGLGFLVIQGHGASSGYRMVDKLMEQPGRWVGKEMKIHGWVEPGSIDIKIENQQTRRTFVLGKSGKRITVHFEGPAPDTFKDSSEVVALGRLTQAADGSYAFDATELMAKCPSKYEGSESNKKLGERPSYDN